MKPALSIILFTTIAGGAQGVVVVLAAATLAGVVPAAALAPVLAVVTSMLLVALVASFHPGHPLRAWRTVLMWRTSYSSREVIVLPAFIALVVGWTAWAFRAQHDAEASHWLVWLAIAGAFALWYCTAMIYACIRFVQKWAHPLTIVNYTTLGPASGAVTAGALAVPANLHSPPRLPAPTAGGAHRRDRRAACVAPAVRRSDCGSVHIGTGAAASRPRVPAPAASSQALSLRRKSSLPAASPSSSVWRAEHIRARLLAPVTMEVRRASGAVDRPRRRRGPPRAVSCGRRVHCGRESQSAAFHPASRAKYTPPTCLEENPLSAPA